MKDLRGTTIYVGDLVEYFVLGDLERNSNELFKVVEINYDSNKLGAYFTELVRDNDEAPFAILVNTNGGYKLDSPFFSRELRKPEPEDLI